MSFAAETKNIVDQLIQAEYKNACKQFGEKYHSLHEGYAVLKEEIEEVKESINRIDDTFALFWENIKNNETGNSLWQAEYDFPPHIKHCIKELAQCGAVLQKIQNTIFGEVKK